MLLHNESGKWLKWSEAQAYRLLRAGESLVVHHFSIGGKPTLCCIWFG